MAFLIDATMMGYKVLGVTSGVSKKGTHWRSISVFREGRTAELSCSDAALFPSVDALREMDVCNFPVRAVAGRERSYVMLVAEPMYVERAGA